MDIALDVIGEKFAQPLDLHRRAERQNCVHLAVAAFDLADFCRDKKRTVLHHAFAREHAAPAVNQFAAQCALIQAARHAVAEADENALLQILILHLAWLRVEALVFGDAQKLIKQRPDLFRGDGVDAQLAARVHAELVVERKTPGAHQNPKIRRRLFAEQIFPRRIHFLAAIAQQQIASLRQRRDEARLMHAAVCLRREQHPRITRMQRKRQHLAADLRDFVFVNRAQVRQQLLRVRQRNFIRCFQPAELAQLLHARGFQRQHDLGQIQSFNLRQFLRGTMRVFLARPKSHAHARRGAARAARALIGGRLGNFVNEQRVDAAVRIVTRDAREAGIDHQPHAVNCQ